MRQLVLFVMIWAISSACGNMSAVSRGYIISQSEAESEDADSINEVDYFPSIE